MANFVMPPEDMDDAYYHHFDDDASSSSPREDDKSRSSSASSSRHRAAILDRGRELSSRMGTTSDDGGAMVKWDAMGNSIEYVRNDDADGRPGPVVHLDVVRRIDEMPSDAGFGSDEVYGIISSAGEGGGDGEPCRSRGGTP